MYQPSQAWKYIPARRPLTTFAAITVMLIICTIINAIMCMLNFNKGLRDHVVAGKRISTIPPAESPTSLGRLSRRKVEEQAEDPTNYLHPKKPISRMTIE